MRTLGFDGCFEKNWAQPESHCPCGDAFQHLLGDVGVALTTRNF